jgi:hypothetical protein
MVEETPVVKKTRRAASRPAGPAGSVETAESEKPAEKAPKKVAKKTVKAKAPLFQVATETPSETKKVAK